MTKDELLAELLVERYGPRLLPPVAPTPLVRPPLDVPAPPPEPRRRRGHLVVLDGGPTATTAA